MLKKLSLTTFTNTWSYAYKKFVSNNIEIIKDIISNLLRFLS